MSDAERDSSDRTPGPELAADGYNAGYADRLYERALRERGIIPPSLASEAAVRTEATAAPEAAPRSDTPPVSPEGVASTEDLEAMLRLAAIGGALVESYRDFGHLGARLDPLGTPPPLHPMLSPEFHGVERGELASIPASAVQLERLGATVGDVLDRLEEVYCGAIGYELDHVENPAERDWLIDYIESGRHTQPLSATESRDLLNRLIQVEGLEHFLHRSYLGKKRFSIEGLDMMVPVLDAVISGAADWGVQHVFLGMAHRGRLNVLSHIIGVSYESIIAEFEEEISRGIQTALPESGSGDVKYHVGGKARVAEMDLEVHLSPNPSHLEFVDPVVLGMARGARFVEGSEDSECMLPILIHGDASFAGQGVVAETLNLSRLPAYETGGTIHVVANNQLGFTTMPRDSRSTRYASDLALGFRMPVVHVNADDPEACLAAARLAVDYRFEFGADLVIDLIGYRRYGHNEGDEPGYTQPLMYRKINDLPTVRQKWAEHLVGTGVVTREEADSAWDDMAARLHAAREAIQAGDEEPTEASTPPIASAPPVTRPEDSPAGFHTPPSVDTGVPAERLRQLNQASHDWPEDFELFHKLGRQLQRRRDSVDSAIDWAHAETLAFASLLTEGIPIRFTGEDTERGTFSQRHLVLHDRSTGETIAPLQRLSEDQATFEIANSPLSEIATLGFEYGFSTIAGHALVLWEAQFGDFANVSQAVIDQFLAAGHSKWGQESRLALLLPHAYEGQGPEHSSARLERFLQLAAQGNIRVVNCTTPAQYFHLLRLQALRPDRRPLVVMTPKSLLRHPRARSSLSDLSEEQFRPVLAEPASNGEAARITRALLCSGKVYYDLVTSEHREKSPETAILRVEQLYPFPREEIAAALGVFPDLEEIRWVQEEPANMGAWSFIRDRLQELAPPGKGPMYVGRRPKASPAEGYAGRHAEHQRAIVSAAFAPRGP